MTIRERILQTKLNLAVKELIRIRDKEPKKMERRINKVLRSVGVV